MQVTTSKDSEEKTTWESFNGHVPLWFDTGQRNEEGNRIMRSLDTNQEQVFLDQEK